MFKKKEKRQSIASQYSKRTQMGEIWYRLRKNKGAMVGLAIVLMFTFIAIFADVLFDYDTQIAGYNLRAKLVKPCWEHPFGTDDMGRDLFARLLYGSRYSIAIALSAVLFGGCIGLPLGAMCGYLGGKFDLIAMRLMDVLRSIPGILLGTVLRFVCAFLTGVFFWGEGAGEQNVFIYSAVYNGTYLIPETIICLVFAMIPQIRKLARPLSLFR